MTRAEADHAEEGRQTGRLWVLGLVLGLGLFFATGAGIAERLEALTSSKSAQANPRYEPGSPTGFERGLRVGVLNGAFDGLQYIQHAQDAAASGKVRVRDTSADNAPCGREMHWSQALIWLLVVAGWVHAQLAGCPHGAGIEAVAAYVMPVIFVVTAVPLVMAVRGRIGDPAAGVLGFALGACLPLSSAMTFGQFDHHGPAAVAALFMVICLVIAWQEATGEENPAGGSAAGRWAVMSGLAGAVAMWLSASATVPCIMAIGLGLLAGSWIEAKDKSRVIRLWGGSGAAAALLFYLLEYFPFRMGMRLEVNHPLYALAWFCGAELTAQIARARTGAGGAFGPSGGLRMAALAAGALLPAAAVGVFGSAVFVPLDRFVSDVHSLHITEFDSMAETAAAQGVAAIVPWVFVPVLALVSLAAACWLRKRPGPALLASLPLIVMTALSIQQIRWSIPSNALGVAALVLSVSVLSRPACGEGAGHRGKSRGKAGFFAAAAAQAAAVVGMFALQAEQAVKDFQNRSKPDIVVEGLDSFMLSARAVGHLLAERMPPGARPVILSSPTMSLATAYYGGGKSIGTYYWENAEGLKAADRLFLARDEQELLKGVKTHGITHIVMPLGELDELVSDGLGGRKRFGMGPLEGWYLERALATKRLPSWLSPLALPKPEAVKFNWAAVLEVRLGQTRAGALVARGDYELASGNRETARERYQAAAEAEPALPEAWLRLAEIAEDEAARDAMLERAVESSEAASLARAAVALARGQRTVQPAYLEAALERFLNLAPEDPDLRVETAIRLMADAPKEGAAAAERLARARDLVEKVSALGCWSRVRRTLAGALLAARSGQREAAREEFTRAFSQAREEDLPVYARTEIVKLLAESLR